MQTITQHAATTMSPSDFAALGVGDVAYIKPVTVEGKPSYAVHAVDGTALAMVDDWEIAHALVLQNDLEPVSAH